MVAGIARLQMDHVMGVIMMQCGPLMLVCSGSVMVFGMIVVGVRVGVQRSDLAGRRGQDQSEQNRNAAMHNASVCNRGRLVKRRSAALLNARHYMPDGWHASGFARHGSSRPFGFRGGVK